MIVFRVGDGTVPLAIVIYIDGSFVKHSIPVKPIYITADDYAAKSGQCCVREGHGLAGTRNAA